MGLKVIRIMFTPVSLIQSRRSPEIKLGVIENRAVSNPFSFFFPFLLFYFFLALATQFLLLIFADKTEVFVIVSLPFKSFYAIIVNVLAPAAH